jgi:flavin reductase (DIM6/NTAB) family NADH-FMN oxidoreductase RutF
MNLFKKITKRLEGLRYSQAYLCLSKESFQLPLRANLIEKGEPVRDVTDHHAFVGYCPLIFALSSNYSGSSSEKITIIFSQDSSPETGPLPANAVLAKLKFKRINTIKTDDGDLNFYEGVSGEHHFTPFVAQAAGQLYNRLYNSKPGNIFLAGNLYKQVQIAYSLPRKISLITVEKNGLFNLFPTDLHGQVSDQYYVISLRQRGLACAQVEASKKIVLSDMNSAAFRMVYSLGKNHMQPLKESSFFSFSGLVSGAFKLPIPQGSVSYKELQVEQSFDAGIHKLFLFKIKNSGQVDRSLQTLAHIHNAYATWRFKQGIQNTFLLR